MKTFLPLPLPLLLGVLLPCLAAGQTESVSTVRFQSIGLETRIESKLGVWEEVELDFKPFINFSDRTVDVQCVDQYQWPQGCIFTLMTPDGKESVWGTEYVDPVAYPLMFAERADYTQPVAPGDPLDFFTRTISVQRLFGQLPAGAYKLRMKIAGERYRVDGKPGGDLDSGWLPFEIVPMTPQVQKILGQAAAQFGKARILPAKSVMTLDFGEVSVPAILENNGAAPVEFCHEGDWLAHGFERLDGNLQWSRPKERSAGCGVGVGLSHVAPGTQRRIHLSFPSRRGIFRAVLFQGRGESKVYSPPILVVGRSTAAAAAAAAAAGK